MMRTMDSLIDFIFLYYLDTEDEVDALGYGINERWRYILISALAPIILYIAISTNAQVFTTASNFAPWFIVGGSLWDISTLFLGENYEEGLGRLPILPRLLDFVWAVRYIIFMVASLFGMSVFSSHSEFNDWANQLAFTVTGHYSLMFFIFTYLQWEDKDEKPSFLKIAPWMLEAIGLLMKQWTDPFMDLSLLTALEELLIVLVIFFFDVNCPDCMFDVNSAFISAGLMSVTSIVRWVLFSREV